MVHPSFFVPRKIRSDPCRGLKVVDVVGWAPTADTLALAENKCTKERFTGFTIVQPTVTTANANNEACWTEKRIGEDEGFDHFFRWWYGNSTNFIGKCWQTIKFWGTLLTPTLGQTHRCVECGGKTSKYDGWWYFNEYVSNYAIMPWPFSRVATHFSTKLCHM